MKSDQKDELIGRLRPGASAAASDLLSSELLLFLFFNYQRFRSMQRCSPPDINIQQQSSHLEFSAQVLPQVLTVKIQTLDPLVDVD